MEHLVRKGANLDTIKDANGKTGRQLAREWADATTAGSDAKLVWERCSEILDSVSVIEDSRVERSKTNDT